MRTLWAVLAGLWLSAASAQIDTEVNQLTVANFTGQALVFVFVSPGDSTFWGPDLLKSKGVLANDFQVSFYVHYPDACNVFDFMGIGSDGTVYQLPREQICDGNAATLAFTPASGQGLQSDFARMTVQLQNLTSTALAYLFVSPADSVMLGVDMLDAETVLGRGETVELVIPRENREATYDVHAFGEDGSHYEFQMILTFGDGAEEDRFRFLIEESDASF